MIVVYTINYVSNSISNYVHSLSSLNITIIKIGKKLKNKKKNESICLEKKKNKDII